MSFAQDLLKKINYNPVEEVKTEKVTARQREFSAAPDVACGFVSTERGPMRTTKSGKIDGRSLQRGKSKQWDRKPRGVRSYEHLTLRNIFDNAKPGEEYAWDWRTDKTYDDLKLRNAQLAYAYKIANVYGHKVSISSVKNYMVIRYVSRIES